MTLVPGDTLFNDHYRIIRQLGRGGFGVVYQAQDTLLGEDVAIKEMIPAQVGDDAMLKRFLAEARATMRLRHKRIVATHNIFSENDNYYIVMEYMAGGSLEERLRDRGPLTVLEAVQVAAEVCEGLACAHEEGVVHCDLKPHNILFGADGTAKVADFGIAHVSGEMLTRSWMTPAGFVAGTLPYMSPEQADGVRDDPRVDVYALGAVLYRMLTGRTYLDFDQRETPGAQADNVNRIRSQEPTAPSTYNRRIPNWLDRVVLKALEKDPEQRYAGTSEMQAGLDKRGVAAPIPLPAVAATTVTSGPRQHPARRPARLWSMIGGATVLLVAIIVGAVMLFGGGDGPKETPTSEAAEMAVATSTSAPTSTSQPTRTSLPPTSTQKLTDKPQPADTARPTASQTPTFTPTRTRVPPTSTRTPSSTPRPPTPTSYPATATAKLTPITSSDPSLVTLRWLFAGFSRQVGEHYMDECEVMASAIPKDGLEKISDETLEVYTTDQQFIEYVTLSGKVPAVHDNEDYFYMWFTLGSLPPGRYFVKITWNDSTFGFVGNPPAIDSGMSSLDVTKAEDGRCWSD